MKNGYPKNSFYNFDSFAPRKLEIRANLAREIIKDFIIIHDLFDAANTFVNHGHEQPVNNISAEEKFNGINKLFTLGMIEREDHKDILETMSFKLMDETKDKDIDVRVNLIEEAWRKKIMELREI